MPVILPVLGAIVEFLVANGTRAAITKFGQQAVKQATKQMSNVQKKQAQKNILNKQGEINEAFAAANARTQQLLSKQRPAPKFNQAERIRGQEAIKVKGRNKRIEGQAPSRRFDAEGDLIDEIPLKFAEGDVVQGIGSMNMYNQMYAAGDEVSSGRRPGTVGPNVQRDMPGRMTGVADKVLTGSGRPPVGTMASPRSGLLPTQTLSRMGTLSRGGIAGLVAAGGLGLFEIGRQTGFDPEKLGQAAAQVQKSLEEVANEAAEVARELGEPIGEFVGRVVQGYRSEMGQGRTMSDMDRNEMQQPEQPKPFLGTLPMDQVTGPDPFQGIPLEMAAGGEVFPDLTGDGQVTQADILRGRGVFAEGGDVSRGTDEVDQALQQIDSVKPEVEMLNEVVMMVMKMIQSGASEEEIIAALQQMDMDEEDIQIVFQMVMEKMQGQQQDPIQAELSQMA